VFSVGTTSVFPYIAEPVLQARARGALTVEVNPGETSLSGIVDEKIAHGAADVLAAIRDRLR
jgi:NAD-dependent deacetylase